MISFDKGEMRFNYRAAGVILHNGCVLLNCTEGSDHWFLPGGRVELGETSAQALRREMREELWEDAQIGQLLWIAESFFNGVEGKNYHELSFYYLMNFAPESPLYRTNEPLIIMEGQVRMIVQWFALEKLNEITLYPPFLVQGLQELPEQTTHVLDGQRKA